MKIIGIVLGVILGVVLFLSLIAFIIYKKITKFGKDLGFGNMKEIKELIKKGEEDFYNEPKHAPGMTKLLLPKIVEDFPNFSESELFNKAEICLLSIFKSLEDKEVSKVEELKLIKSNLKEIINDYKQNKITVSFDDIKFHNHAIKYYKKNPGVINITVSTSLEYYYEKKDDKKVIVKKDNHKKQTLYTLEFIYIYDPEKYDSNQTLIGVHCPNCGAPVKSLGQKVCSYCSSGLEDINLKNWYISSFKENY